MRVPARMCVDSRDPDVCVMFACVLNFSVVCFCSRPRA